MGTVRSPDERLRDAARLFQDRNQEYGANYREWGAVMAAMYPQGLTVRTQEEWLRLCLQVVRVMKETRYAKNFVRGGHQDSMDDLSVYAMMAAEMDEIAGLPLIAGKSLQKSELSQDMPWLRPTPPLGGETGSDVHAKPAVERGPPVESGERIGEIVKMSYTDGWTLWWKWAVLSSGEGQWVVCDPPRSGPPTPH